ncbi:MAG: MFS family permease [Candidatus Promineifilaceae bacterium]|jgi:MFS family permease
MAIKATLTDVQKISKLPWLITGDAFNVGFFLFSLSGPAFLLFLDELGLDTVQIGVMLSLVPFFGVLSPFFGRAVVRFGYKRTFLIFRSARITMIGLILLTPWISDNFGGQTTFYFVALVIAGFSFCRAVSETASFPWFKMMVPDSMRGKFGALGGMLSTFASIFISIISAYIIDQGDSGLTRFIILFGIGVALGYLSILMYSQVPREVSLDAVSEKTGLSEIRLVFKDREFFSYMIGVSLISIGGLSIISFIPLYMEKEIGLQEGQVVFLSIGTHIGALLTSYLWGWTADRYGSKPIMQTGILFLWLLPVCWALLPANSSSSFPLAILVAVVTGIAMLAWQIGWTRYIYTNTPESNKTPYMTMFFAWEGIASGVGPLLAGQILYRFDGLSGQWFIFRFSAYTPLFILSFVLLGAGFVIISRLTPGDDTSFRRFTSMFLRGNMIRGIESLIQFNYAGEEDYRIATTEKMGDARSPFSHNELIAALYDPSFNVRYQAINSISRMKPEPELIDALLDILADDPSELSFIITRALGRLGDKKAIKPLRGYLNSGYHMLEANSARALAMLGDKEIVPVLHNKLINEPVLTLKIGFATALGKLNGTVAVNDLFKLFRELHIEVQRGEVGLALVRLLGDERYYTNHWRAFRDNPGTSIAQAVLGLRRLTHDTSFGELAVECADCFAENDLLEGVQILRTMISNRPTGIIDPTINIMMRECANLLEEFGAKRTEYILLTLHVLDASFRDAK